MKLRYQKSKQFHFLLVISCIFYALLNFLCVINVLVMITNCNLSDFERFRAKLLLVSQQGERFWIILL
ncbi:MAG TPA: hypothetical protein DCO77_02595 [Nitrospiraceae bacterium]|nr:hypothetical protein [Nitrospiraceae bacterium]